MGWAIFAAATLLGGVVAFAIVWFWSKRSRRCVDASVAKALSHLDTIIAASIERPELPLTWAAAHAKIARMHLEDARCEPLALPGQEN